MRPIFIVLIFCLASCAPLGSRSKVYDSNKLNQIKTVGLITKHYDQPRHPYHTEIKAAFNKTVINQLIEKGLFRVVILDTMDNEKFNILNVKSDSTVDAFLIVEWKTSNSNYTVADANVNISIIDPMTMKELLTARHGTLFGNSYMRVPPLPATVLDATKGAFNAMQEKLNKIL